MIYLVYFIGDVSNISNTFYHNFAVRKSIGILGKPKIKCRFVTENVHLRIRHNNFSILLFVTYMLYLRNLCVATSACEYY